MAEKANEVTEKLQLINNISEKERELIAAEQKANYYKKLDGVGDVLHPSSLENKLADLNKMRDCILNVQRNIDTIRHKLQHPEVSDALHVREQYHKSIIDVYKLSAHSSDNVDNLVAAIDSVVGTDFRQVEKQVAELKSTIHEEFSKLDYSMVSMKNFHKSLDKGLGETSASNEEGSMSMREYASPSTMLSEHKEMMTEKKDSKSCASVHHSV